MSKNKVATYSATDSVWVLSEGTWMISESDHLRIVDALEAELAAIRNVLTPKQRWAVARGNTGNHPEDFDAYLREKARAEKAEAELATAKRIIEQRSDVSEALAKAKARIAELEAENERWLIRHVKKEAGR